MSRLVLTRFPAYTEPNELASVPICNLPQERVLLETETTLAFFDAYSPPGLAAGCRVAQGTAFCARPGDIVYSFADGAVQGFGTAQTHCYTSPRPDKFGHIGQAWNEVGWRMDIDFQPFTDPIPPPHATHAGHRADIGCQVVHRSSVSPFTSSGLILTKMDADHRN
jgi:hypothetical protein